MGRKKTVRDPQSPNPKGSWLKARVKFYWVHQSCTHWVKVSLRSKRSEVLCVAWSEDSGRAKNWGERKKGKPSLLFYATHGTLLARQRLLRRLRKGRGANEDTMFRTHCGGHKCFPVCPRAQHLLQTQICVRDTKQKLPRLLAQENMSSNVSATNYVSATFVTAFKSHIKRLGRNELH